MAQMFYDRQTMLRYISPIYLPKLLLEDLLHMRTSRENFPARTTEEAFFSVLIPIADRIITTERYLVNAQVSMNHVTCHVHGSTLFMLPSRL